APAPETPHISKVLGELDGLTIASYPATGFDRLTPDQRALAYHLVSAALIGESVHTMQRSRFGLPAQKAVRAILANGDRLDAQVREKLATYRRLLLMDGGLHDRWTGQKFVPPLTRAEFEKAARDAKVPVPGNLLAAMFDPKVVPTVINKTPGAGKDPLVESAANNYEGLTSKDLHLYQEKYELNGRLVKQNGKIVEQVYRAGDAKTPAGLAAPQFLAMIEHLQAAIELAPPAQKEALRHLVNYFATGDGEEFRKHDIAWLAQTFPVDYILGFIETYLDVRGRKGAFEGYVGIPDPDRSPPLQALAQQAAYFEQKMPWPKEYKRDVLRPPAAAAVNVIAATGAAGFFTFSGVNLPNPADLRETYGSKNFISLSIGDVRSEIVGKRTIEEFVPAESRADAERCAQHLRYAGVAFHEVVGHGSGKVSPAAGDPHKALSPYYGTLEEGRANLVAHYMSGDPKALELGLLPDAACVRVWPTFYEAASLQLMVWTPEGDRIEEDHMRGDYIRQGIFREKGVVTVEEREGKIFLIVKDPEAWRRAAGELLAEHQRIKATGDKVALVALVEKYGTHLNTAWRDQVVARTKALNLPRGIATVPPILTPIRDASDKVIDAKAEQVTSLDVYLDILERAGDSG
ncbi:MAG TPA: hypothetical protein VNO21_10280, partial [Polyangiaceae bacterium]|nr:hypothetical protein [Polyangiaceae bacterium]